MYSSKRQTFLFIGGFLGIVFQLFSEEPLHRRIDEIIQRKAGKARFAQIADDANFFRRVNLDLTGIIPTSNEVTSFLEDKTDQKRKKLIDRLIAGD